jgi:hypothetical protein
MARSAGMSVQQRDAAATRHHALLDRHSHGVTVSLLRCCPILPVVSYFALANASPGASVVLSRVFHLSAFSSAMNLVRSVS